jgi:perosamine synthetase
VTTGPEVSEFEREIGRWIGCDQAIAVSSCTQGIELSLRALGLEPGAKVLASTMTFCGAVNAILHAGLRPVLVDVDPATLMPDARTTAEAVDRADGVDAMTVVHYAGHPAPVEELAEAAGVPLSRVVEDAAHALGTFVGTRAVGTISAATCFSFYATKNLPIGEGGLVTTADPGIAESVRRGRLHGMSRDAWKRYLPGSNWRYGVETPGLKANMTDVQAAIGRAQLLRLNQWQADREELAKRYDDRLTGIDRLSLPARPTDGRHAWHLYVIQVDRGFELSRDSLIERLAEEGIDCSVHFTPVHHMEYMRALLVDAGTPAFPGADEAFERIVSLPLYPSLSFEEVDFVCDVIKELGEARRGSHTREPVDA